MLRRTCGNIFVYKAVTEQKFTLESLNQNPPLDLVTLVGGVNVIGRTAEADIVIDEPAISREHCAIFKIDDYWVFTDFGSTNGSWVNTEKIEDGDLVLLRHGDTIQIAGIPLRAKLSAPLQSKSGFKLLLFQGREFVGAHTSGTLDVGRDSNENPIGKEGHEDSSAVFSFEDDFVRVTVTPSKKGVLLNNKRAIGTHKLSDRDVIKAGEYSVVAVDLAQSGQLKPLAIKPHASSQQISSEGTPQPAYVFGAPELIDEPTHSTTSSFNRDRLEARYKRRGGVQPKIGGQQMVLVYAVSFLVICALIFGIAYVSLAA